MDFGGFGGFGGGGNKSQNRTITMSQQVADYIRSMKQGNYFNNTEQQFAFHDIENKIDRNFPTTPPNQTPDADLNNIINNIIADTKQNLSEGISLNKCTNLNRLTKQKNDQIKEYAKQGYPKPALIWFLAYKAGFMEAINQQIVDYVLTKQWNPLFCAFIGKQFYISGNPKGKQLIQFGIKYGQALAFQFMGEILEKEKKYRDAFIMYKNADLSGYQYGSWIHLADMYNSRLQNLIFCPYKAFDYEKKVANLLKYSKQYIPSEEAYFRVMGGGAVVKSETKQQIKKQIELFEGNLIASFLEGKIYDFIDQARNTVFAHRVMVQRFRSNIRYHGLQSLKYQKEAEIKSRQQKVYEIAMKFNRQSSGFLGVDVATNKLELIIVDNWKKIKAEDLDQLLDQQGYFILVKKFSVQENGFTVHTRFENMEPYQLPVSCSYKIDVGKIRDMGRTLLTNKYELRSIILYDYLIDCKAPDMHILYGNKAYAMDKLDRYDEAEKWYKRSLQVNKKYDKSYMRLGHLYAKQGKILFALQVAQQVQDKAEKANLIAKIEEAREKFKAAKK